MFDVTVSRWASTPGRAVSSRMSAPKRLPLVTAQLFALAGADFPSPQKLWLAVPR